MTGAYDTMDRPMIGRLRDLYKRDEAARKFLDWARQRTNDAAQTSIERLARKADLERRDAIDLARDLEDIGCGEFVVGRRGAKSRIVWHHSLKSIGQAAAGRSEELMPVDPDLVEETTEAGQDAPAVTTDDVTLAVRLSRYAQQALVEATPTRDIAGASALARDILESWVQARLTEGREESIKRAASYLRNHPQGWADDPVSFFPAAKE